MRADELHDALRDAAGALPTADLSVARGAVSRRVRNHRRRRAVAVAAVVLVAVCLGVFISRNGDDSSQHVVTGTDQVPRLVPAYVSEGLGLSSVSDLPASTPAGQPYRRRSLTIYGNGSDDDPLDGSSVGIVVARVNLGAPGTNPGTRGSVETHSLGGFNQATISVDATTYVIARSRQLSQDELSTVINSVTLAPDGTADHLDLPSDFRVVVPTRSNGDLGGLVPGTDRTGYVAVWTSPGSVSADTSYVIVSAIVADQGDLDSLRWNLVDPTTVEVDGHPAVLGSLDGGYATSSSNEPGGADVVTPYPRSWVASWLRDGTTMVTVTVMGGSPGGSCDEACRSDEVQRVAKSLRAVGAAGWESFLAATTTTTADPGCTFTSDSSEVCSSSGTDSPVTTSGG